MLLKDQERASKVVKGFIEADRIPTALLFLGPQGVGKTAISLDTAGSILCLEESLWGCGECRSCRAFFPQAKELLSGLTEKYRFTEESGGRRRLLYLRLEHPDFVAVVPDGNSIKVHQIRAVKEFAYIKPALSGRKVILIDGCDNMTPEASNALLKVLEEPPADTHFILTALKKESILPTVLSRTVAVNLGPLPEEVFSELVGGNGNLYDISGGSVTKALILTQDGEILALAEKFVKGDLTDRIRIGERIESADQDKKMIFIDILESKFIDAYMKKAMDYSKFETLLRKVGEIREGITRGIRLSLGLSIIADIMED